MADHQVHVRFPSDEYTALCLAVIDLPETTISSFVRRAVAEKLERLGRSLEKAA